MIYNNDCIDQLNLLIQEGIKVDCIITDLPYGTTNEPWDQIIPYDQMWGCIHKISYDTTPVLLFGQEPFSSYLRLSNIKEWRYDIYWEKERITNVMQVKRRPGKVIENISVFYKKQCYYCPQMIKYDGPKRGNKVKDGKLGRLVDSGKGKPIEYEDTGLRYPTQLVKFKRDILTSNLHPTQKPVDLLKYLINTFTKENDLVLDFTMGSGSTGVAALQLNRRFIGIEKDPEYYNIANERLKDINF